MATISKNNCVIEFLNTLSKDDELKTSIKNVFEGNFMSPEEDANIICWCFTKDNQQINKLKSIIAAHKIKISELEEKIAKDIKPLEDKIQELNQKNANKILIIMILVITILVVPILIFNP